MLETELSALLRASKLARATRRPWICSPCRNSSPWLRRRAMGTTATRERKKPYYVTTPIFYVNAAPHIGHLYSVLLADILKRWQVLMGDTDAKMLTGTDEHGMKIQQAAAAQDMEPQALCDQNCQTFKALANAGNVSYDHFIRTTDREHKDAVRHFWEMLKHRGYIYTSKHEGWYSVSDETFYPQSAVQPTVDPATGRKIITSIETGKEVEWSSEENYHFRLSAFKDKLLQFYQDNPDFIRPSNYMENIVKSVASGLQDLSVSRPVERLSWGIQVPGDESQIIYVWLDALVNYLTYAGYPFTPGQESKSIWPANVQVVGKDILRFHCIYWPAFLMALDIPPPRQVLAHAHWTIGHEKMSKSTGVVVNPMFAVERFGVDPIRYFLAIDGPGASDSDYDNSYIIERYKKGLQHGLGNLASRMMRPKRWNARTSILWKAKGMLSESNDLDIEHQKLLMEIADKAKAEMEGPNVRKALEAIMNIVFATNKYVQTSAPWNLEKDPDRSQRSRTNLVVYNAVESLRITGILLQPFIPDKAGELLDIIGVAREPGRRSFDMARYGADLDYGIPLVDMNHKTGRLLFPPLMSLE